MSWRRLTRQLKGLIVAQATAKQPQLRMEFSAASAPPILPLPAGYGLRTFQAGDEEAWAVLLNANGELGCWDRQRIEGQLAGGLVRQAQYFVTAEGQLVSCTGVYDRAAPDQEPCWEIGWVANHPDHRGKRAGTAAVAAATAAAKDMQARTIYLFTDDYRIAAIKVYLKLGFRPLYQHPSFPGRWTAVFKSLGEPYREFNPRK